MDTLVLAYLAGIIDGEGYIGKLLADTLGGNYYREEMAQRRGRQLYCWQASDAQAAGILRALLPYLRIKRNSTNAARR